MHIRMSSILEVLANEPSCECHTMNDTPLLPKEGISETLEHMLVVLIGSDVIRANEEIKQIEMNEMRIDQRGGGKQCDVGQICQSLSSTRLPIRGQRNKPEFGDIPLCICGIHNSLEKCGMLAGRLFLAASRDKYGLCTIKLRERT